MPVRSAIGRGHARLFSERCPVCAAGRRCRQLQSEQASHVAGRSSQASDAELVLSLFRSRAEEGRGGLHLPSWTFRGIRRSGVQAGCWISGISPCGHLVDTRPRARSLLAYGRSCSWPGAHYGEKQGRRRRRHAPKSAPIAVSDWLMRSRPENAVRAAR